METERTPVNGFNPFEKDIQYIELSDIESLRSKQVSEGFFIEYKSDFPINQKISHSIASFANTHGGWYVVGIQVDANNVPEKLLGFDLAKFPNPKEKIRDIIASHINPSPLFFAKLLQVNGNRGILVVHIPESYETPHLTKDGKVYRRTGEASEPVPENDRYTIDKLYDKSKRFEATIEHFCINPIVTSQAQANQGWIEVYLITYPIEKLLIDHMLMHEKIDSIKLSLDTETEIKAFKLMGQASGDVPFNNVSTSYDSIVFRQIRPENLGDLTLSFEFFQNGNAKIIIPFQYIDPSRDKDSENLQFLRGKLGDKEYLFNIIDGFNLFSTFLILLNKYQELLEAEGWADKLIIKYRIENCWRHVLFFDSKAFVDHVEKYGVPISQREKIEIPSYSYRNWFTNSFERLPDQTLAHVAMIAQCLGLTLESFLQAIFKDMVTYINKSRS